VPGVYCQLRIGHQINICPKLTELKRQQQTVLLPKFCKTTIQYRGKCRQIQSIEKSFRSQHAERDVVCAEYRLVLQVISKRILICPGPDEQQPIDQYFNGGEQWVVAIDLKLNKRVSCWILAINKIDSCALILGRPDQAGRNRHLIGPVLATRGDDRAFESEFGTSVIGGKIQVAHPAPVFFGGIGIS